MPAWLTPFFYSINSKAYTSYFYRSGLIEKEMTIKVKKGIYQLSGNFIVVNNSPMDAPQNYVVEKMIIVTDKEKMELAKDKADKFKIEIKENNKILTTVIAHN